MDDIRRRSKCNSLSPESNFYEDITKIDGYRHDCKDCTNQYRIEKSETYMLRKKEKWI